MIAIRLWLTDKSENDGEQRSRWKCHDTIEFQHLKQIDCKEKERIQYYSLSKENGGYVIKAKEEI